MYTVLHNSNLEIRGFWPKALEIHCFWKEKSLQYIGINLMKCGFELHGFFLEPKSAYLEALLYLYKKVGSHFFKGQVCLLLLFSYKERKINQIRINSKIFSSQLIIFMLAEFFFSVVKKYPISINPDGGCRLLGEITNYLYNI